MYAKEFEDLLKEYLTDGIITSKERQVLLKKAKELGYDVDEVDLYIDAQQQKTDQEVEIAASKRRGKTCPYCGASVPPLADKCPQCGQEITPEASEELAKLMDQLDEALIELKRCAAIKGQGMTSEGVLSDLTGNSQKKYKEACANYSAAKGEVENSLRRIKLLYSNNPKVKILIEDANKELAKASKEANKLKIYALIALAVLVIFIPSMIYICSNSGGSNNEDTSAITTNISSDQIIQQKISDVSKLVKDGDLSGADEYLNNLTLPDSLSGKYDDLNPAYQTVINAYIKDNDYDSAESLALIFRGKIGNDLTWKNTPIYHSLKAKYKAAGRDFSVLKSEYDTED